MNPLYMASIAGLAVGLFHDPGPTLAAQYPKPQYDDPLIAAAIASLKRRICDCVGTADASQETLEAFLEALADYRKADRKD